MRHHRVNLLEGDVTRHLWKLAVPLAWGMVAMSVFSVADTWFISHLGTRYLAALGFTIPVTMLYMGVLFGLNIGTSSALSRVYGEGDMARFRRMATDAIALAAVVVTCAAIIGFCLVGPVFRLMGAGDAVMPIIWKYMAVWYCGLPFMGVMMVGNACMRAAGDTRYPSMVMTAMAVLNVVFDPFLIFGWGPFPRLELQGTATAVLLASATTCAISLWQLGRKRHMLAFPVWHAGIFASWKKILHVAGPAIVSNQIMPLSVAVVTWLASSFGREAVAALGVAMRVEGMAILVFYAFGAGTSIIVGQNFGAGNHGRVRESMSAGMRYAFLWAVLVAGLFWIFAHHIAAAFTDSPVVAAYVAQYLRWVPVSYTGLGVMIISNAALNAVGKPLRSTALIMLKAFVFYIPLAWWGQHHAGFIGILIALMVTDMAVGAVALALNKKAFA
jgi:putative MATE family efflux protein